jgi:hypothetical protein
LEDGTIYAITAEQALGAAFKVLRMYPDTDAARYIREDNIDAEAADVIIQVACFGEIVYG